MLDFLKIMVTSCLFSYYGDVSLLHVDVEKLHYDTYFSILKFKNSTTCIIANRGTSSLSDIIDDIDSQLTNECIRGFPKAFIAHLNKFVHHQRTVMEHFIDSNYCTTFFGTGHSLGGATIDMFQHDSIVQKVTFGQPKTCCGETKINTTIRVINCKNVKKCDPISLLPLHHNLHSCGNNSILLHSNYYSIEIGEHTHDFGSPRLHHVKHYVNKIMSMDINNNIMR